MCVSKLEASHKDNILEAHGRLNEDLRHNFSIFVVENISRCNAAGILDLRNLIDEKKTNSVFKLANNTNNGELNDLILNHFDKIQVDESKVREGLATFKSKNFLNTFTTQSPRILLTPTKAATTKTTTTTTTTTTRMIKTTQKPFSNTKHFSLSTKPSTNLLNLQANTSMFPFKTSYDPKKGNLNELLQDYLKFSKNINGKNYNASTLSFEKFQTLNKLKNKDQTYLLKKPKANPKSSNFLEYTTTDSPQQYKIKINDSLSKKLIESLQFRTNLGLKPNEKINIVLLKRPIEHDDSQKKEFASSNDKIQNFNEMILNSHKMSKSLIKRPSGLEKNRHLNVIIPSTTDSWLNKLKAKLLPNLKDQHFDAYGVTEPSLSWNHILSQKYKQSINF